MVHLQTESETQNDLHLVISLLNTRSIQIWYLLSINLYVNFDNHRER